MPFTMVVWCIVIPPAVWAGAEATALRRADFWSLRRACLCFLMAAVTRALCRLKRLVLRLRESFMAFSFFMKAALMCWKRLMLLLLRLRDSFMAFSFFMK